MWSYVGDVSRGHEGLMWSVALTSRQQLLAMVLHSAVVVGVTAWLTSQSQVASAVIVVTGGPVSHPLVESTAAAL